MQLQVGKGYVRMVLFENLEFIRVKNPIIIDQNYCDVRGACPELVKQPPKIFIFRWTSLYFNNFTCVLHPLNETPNITWLWMIKDTGVHISNVTYKTMSGTSSTKIAINLNCSRSFPCSEISMEAIHLESATPGKQVTASCTNAHGQEIDVVPGHCLLDTHPMSHKWQNNVIYMIPKLRRFKISMQNYSEKFYLSTLFYLVIDNVDTEFRALKLVNMRKPHQDNRQWRYSVHYITGNEIVKIP